MKRYNPSEIEPKWQKVWDETQLYKADLKSDKPKYIGISMFNYPSGAGIHIGHAMNYTISDVKARFKRQQGYESYHPVGWDSFGLPAENYAIKAGVSPQQSMAKIIPSYHKQYKAMGWSNDWDKEIATHTPEYYKWTQWIFSQMHKNGLAYQDSRMQWWCEKCQTVLANEQIVDDKCWRHDGKDDAAVGKKEVKQWFFKITEYADELLEAVDDLDWTGSVKLAQKNWIGRSVGAEVDFAVKDLAEKITVFTTRPDTLFGATFMVVAPESEIVKKIVSTEQKDAVEEYVSQSMQKSEIERQSAKEKTGVFTGAYAINPVNNQAIPIWIADYVLAGYGTGAIMAVPAHDERDFEFATKFDIPKTQVVAKYFDLGVKDGVETLVRDVVDMIIEHPTDGTFLLEIEKDGNKKHVHFVGGGTDGEADELAIARELEEETGFQNFEIKSLVTSSTCLAYRHTKDKNQHTKGNIYHIKLKDLHQVSSEIDEGKHSVEWYPKEKIAELISWDGHRDGWNAFINGNIHSDEGVMINSPGYDGLVSSDAREKIVADLEKKGLAKEKVNYKMRDWSVSRQRYWGAPIPIINCNDCGSVLVPDDDLPVILPELTDFQPSGDGRSALARASGWLKADCPKCGKPAERETDTLDTYICSSWYMFRYFDPKNEKKIFESDIVDKWMPIDFYNGGDHAVAHLLYARFIARFFSKIGIVENPEPFKQMLFNGKVMASDGSAFSKSKGNGIDPLEIIESGYGADALRTYLMFAAPLEFSARWDHQGVPGAHRFLSRLWTLVQEYLDPINQKVTSETYTTHDLARETHKSIKKVTEDIEENRYNTAIATLMAITNSFYKFKNTIPFADAAWGKSLEAVIALTAPFAPHIAEELWQQLGHTTSVHTDSWPQWDKAHLISDMMKIVVQVNGKVRATVEISADASEEEVLRAAQENEKVAEFISGNSVKKSIYVPKKLVNFVV